MWSVILIDHILTRRCMLLTYLSVEMKGKVYTCCLPHFQKQVVTLSTFCCFLVQCLCSAMPFHRNPGATFHCLTKKLALLKGYRVWNCAPLFTMLAPAAPRFAMTTGKQFTNALLYCIFSYTHMCITEYVFSTKIIFTMDLNHTLCLL